MITSSLVTTPEILWSAIVTGVGAIGGGAARLMHLGHRVNELEGNVEELAEGVKEIKTDFKDDLKYLRDRMDALHNHLLLTAAQPPVIGAPPTNE